MQPQKKELRFGELLVRDGFLRQSQVEHAVTVQKVRQPPAPLGEICVLAVDDSADL